MKRQSELIGNYERWQKWPPALLIGLVSNRMDYVKISDRLVDAGIDNVVKEATELLGEQAGDTIDQVTRDIVVAGTSVNYSSTATSRGGVGSGMVMATADILKAIRTLMTNNARQIDGKWILIIHPLKNVAAQLSNKLRKILNIGESLMMVTPRHRMALVT